MDPRARSTAGDPPGKQPQPAPRVAGSASTPPPQGGVPSGDATAKRPLDPAAGTSGASAFFPDTRLDPHLAHEAARQERLRLQARAPTTTQRDHLRAKNEGGKARSPLSAPPAAATAASHDEDEAWLAIYTCLDWRCPACTLHNKREDARCHVCGTPAPPRCTQARHQGLKGLPCDECHTVAPPIVPPPTVPALPPPTVPALPPPTVPAPSPPVQSVATAASSAPVAVPAAAAISSAGRPAIPPAAAATVAASARVREVIDLDDEEVTSISVPPTTRYVGPPIKAPMSSNAVSPANLPGPPPAPAASSAGWNGVIGSVGFNADTQVVREKPAVVKNRLAGRMAVVAARDQAEKAAASHGSGSIGTVAAAACASSPMAPRSPTPSSASAPPPAAASDGDGKRPQELAELIERGFEEDDLTASEISKLPVDQRDLVRQWCIRMECKDKAKRKAFDENLQLTGALPALAQSLAQLVTIYSCRCERVGFQAKRRTVDHITKKHASAVGPPPSPPRHHYNPRLPNHLPPPHNSDVFMDDGSGTSSSLSSNAHPPALEALASASAAAAVNFQSAPAFMFAPPLNDASMGQMQFKPFDFFPPPPLFPLAIPVPLPPAGNNGGSMKSEDESMKRESDPLESLTSLDREELTQEGVKLLKLTTEDLNTKYWRRMQNEIKASAKRLALLRQQNKFLQTCYDQVNLEVKSAQTIADSACRDRDALRGKLGPLARFHESIMAMGSSLAHQLLNTPSPTFANHKVTRPWATGLPPLASSSSASSTTGPTRSDSSHTLPHSVAEGSNQTVSTVETHQPSLYGDGSVAGSSVHSSSQMTVAVQSLEGQPKSEPETKAQPPLVSSSPAISMPVAAAASLPHLQPDSTSSTSTSNAPATSSPTKRPLKRKADAIDSDANTSVEGAPDSGSLAATFLRDQAKKSKQDAVQA